MFIGSDAIGIASNSVAGVGELRLVAPSLNGSCSLCLYKGNGFALCGSSNPSTRTPCLDNWVGYFAPSCLERVIGGLHLALTA